MIGGKERVVRSEKGSRERRWERGGLATWPTRMNERTHLHSASPHQKLGADVKAIGHDTERVQHSSWDEARRGGAGDHGSTDENRAGSSRSLKGGGGRDSRLTQAKRLATFPGHWPEHSLSWKS